MGSTCLGLKYLDLKMVTLGDHFRWRLLGIEEKENESFSKDEEVECRCLGVVEWRGVCYNARVMKRGLE